MFVHYLLGIHVKNVPRITSQARQSQRDLTCLSAMD
jgi:hypothetical protein